MSEQASTDTTAPKSKKHEKNSAQEVANETSHGEKDTKKTKKKSKKPKKHKKRKSRYKDFIKAAMAPKKRPKKVFTLPAAVHFKKIDQI